MKKNEDKEFDLLIRKSVRETGLNSPSADFTTLVMSEVLSSPEVLSESKVPSKAITFKPLISRAAWVAIVISLIGLIAAVWNGQDTQGQSELFTQYISPLQEELASVFQLIPEVTAYAMVLAAAAFLIQIYFLSKSDERSYIR